MTHPEVRSALVTTRYEGQDMQLVAFIDAQPPDNPPVACALRH